MKKKIILYNKKEECCGCGACGDACSQGAISMEEDELGFVYPQINESVCIGCGLCENICAYKKENHKNSNPQVYAVSLKDTVALKKSTSGGFFGGIAKQWIVDGGVVCGVTMMRRENCLVPQHNFATTTDELEPQLGSKYVQSYLNTTYVDTKKYLEEGIKVLYSGTPCQIDSLKSYLGKEYPNLLTIDLVCHGVPSAKMFQEYIKVEEAKLGATIEDYIFRDKKLGWGLNAKIVYFSGGETKSKSIASYESSYYELFLESEIYRENCYFCPYANGNHPADITIGDFWGIEVEHPNCLFPEGELVQSRGISMVMINSEKGTQAFDRVKDIFWYYPSEFEKVAKHNAQLRQPSSKGRHRKEVCELYKKGGYKAVDRWFWKKKRIKGLMEQIKYCSHNHVLEVVRKAIKKTLMFLKQKRG